MGGGNEVNRCAAVFFLALLLSAPPLALLSAPSKGDALNYTLYGDTRDGWGPSSDNITNPGPRLVVYVGDVVTLTLVGNDTAPHNWFIDYDDDWFPGTDEPKSDDFTGSVVNYTFTADRVGLWTYRCSYHPTTMTGLLEVRSGGRPRNYTLYGDAFDGWGADAENITDPGPTLIVNTGDNVTLTLIGNDTAPHNWFIDYDDDLAPSPGEPSSIDFQGTTVEFNFIPDRPGIWTYRCRVHPTTMTGLIEIRSANGGPPPPNAIRVDLIQAIMIVTVVFVLLFAAAYHVRAVQAHRKSR